jgi:exopolyphosphatase/guanosine-5'-triphosphate,3'-diphosphate pyrophosphatase
MSNRLAVIDLGTNTFHLLIVEKSGNRFSTIHQERIAAKLGAGGINENILTEEAILRALNALREFKKKIDSFNVMKTFCFGTSAIRNANNKNELCQRILSETGIEVNVISGDEEAELIYKGVASAIPLENQPNLIVDIGGGSVEFIIANDKKIFWKQSFEIGGQRLIEKFTPHDPIKEDEIELLNSYVIEQLNSLFEALKKYNPSTLVGSSGSFDTLSEIYSHQKGIEYVPENPETPFTIEAFYSIHELLISKNRSQRMQIPGMVELRVDMIVVGSCLIKGLLDSHSFQTIRVSTYSLKEGVLAILASGHTLQATSGE